MTHQELIQPRLPQCHGQPPCSPPRCAERDGAGEKGLHNSMAWGGSRISTWTCTSRLFAGTFLCTACLPPARKILSAKLCSFAFLQAQSQRFGSQRQSNRQTREGASSPPAGAASTGTQARLTNGNPRTSGMRFLQQGSLPPWSSSIPAKK